MTRYIINSLPKAGNNLLGAYLEETKGVKRSDEWGISSMTVLQPTRSGAINRAKLCSQFEMGIVAGLFMPVEISKRYVVDKLSRVQNNEYIITHMPSSFLSFVRQFDEFSDYEIYTIIRDKPSIIESLYHYIHAEPYHPLHLAFNREKDALTKYIWLIEGHHWEDLTWIGYEEAFKAVFCHRYNESYGYAELYGKVKTKKNHVFRKGTPLNYIQTMPTKIQEMLQNE